MTDRIDSAEVLHIATLARLDLGDEALAKYQAEMSRILEYFGQLSTVDTAGVEPLAHPLPVRNVWAEDVPRDSIGPQAALQNAPQQEAGFFAVPRVLDDSGA